MWAGSPQNPAMPHIVRNSSRWLAAGVEHSIGGTRRAWHLLQPAGEKGQRPKEVVRGAADQSVARAVDHVSYAFEVAEVANRVALGNDNGAQVILQRRVGKHGAVWRSEAALRPIDPLAWKDARQQALQQRLCIAAFAFLSHRQRGAPVNEIRT